MGKNGKKKIKRTKKEIVATKSEAFFYKYAL